MTATKGLRSSCAVAAALLASVLLPAVAPARPYTVKTLTAASGPSPFAAGCPGAYHDEAKVTGLVIEPAITVNPRNPRNLVATWKQDVSALFNARDDVVASSFDAGGRLAADHDPRASLAARAGQATPPATRGSRRAATASSTSADRPAMSRPIRRRSRSSRATRVTEAAGGRRRRRSAPRQGGNEQPAITGSPGCGRHAYMAWANFLKPDEAPPPWTNTVEFSRTTDGGATWSPPVLVDQPGPFAIDQSPRISVLPDGTLLAIFARGDLETGLATLQVARSPDEGRTWLPAVQAGAKPLPGSEVVRSRDGRDPAAARLSQLGGRARRHRLHRLRGQPVAELGRDRRRQLAGRRPHLEQRTAARGQRVRVRARDRGRSARDGRCDLVRPPQRPS